MQVLTPEERVVLTWRLIALAAATVLSLVFWGALLVTSIENMCTV